MDPNSTATSDDLAALLVAYDEAIASGHTPEANHDTSLSVPEQIRLRGAQSCLQRLAQKWPRALGTNAPDTVHDATSDPEIPTQFGRFRILGELGRGGCGVVFHAYDPSLRREVALKVPHPEIVFTPALRSRFLNEAQAAAGLDHPNLVQVYEAGSIGPIPYIASAYCEGPTLAAWLKARQEPVPIRQAAELLARLAEGVHHAHLRGVLHRDLKPANVLLSADADSPATDSSTLPLTPKITDFGLAKLLDGGGDQTRSGAILGTPRYMAPEQAEGRRSAIGPATDVYALGTILY